MERIVYLEARHPYRLFVRFDDGTEGEDDLAGRMNGPVFEPLKDPAFFARVRLAEWGAPCWPNGVDIAPDALYERIRSASADRSA
ncbi:MAG: DUF2442 domain-containing protein [Deltaproteobacteria bacterium]|nr:DUF2442 domain-containing protein [Deltaproteobacteria bacterium]